MVGIPYGMGYTWAMLHRLHLERHDLHLETLFLTQTSTNMLYHEVNEVKNFPPCEDVQGLKVAL